MEEQQSGPIKEEFKLSGSDLLGKIKELIHEGNVRRIIVKQEGRTILEVPLTIGAVGILVAPLLAALGAFAALVAECTIEVEREPEPPADTSK